MRKSRVLLAGVAVAAAAAATSAFTASNAFTGLDNNVAGYGEPDGQRCECHDIDYNPDADAASSTTSSSRRRSDSTPERHDGPHPRRCRDHRSAPYTCVDRDLDAGTTSQPVTCTLTAHRAFADFDTVGLTVGSQ